MEQPTLTPQQIIDAEEFRNLTNAEVQPEGDHIRQARSFHRVLTNKGYGVQEQACIIQALMNIIQGKLS